MERGGEKGTANYLQAWFSNCTCGSRSLRSLLFSLLFGIPLQVPLQLFKCRLHDLSMQIYNIWLNDQFRIRTWSSTLLEHKFRNWTLNRIMVQKCMCSARGKNPSPRPQTHPIGARLLLNPKNHPFGARQTEQSRLVAKNIHVHKQVVQRKAQKNILESKHLSAD